MALSQHGSSSTALLPGGRTEFEILKASHKFLRDDDPKNLSWDDQLASKYYANLYREFAVCDLKHYKTGNFALRWRTESEVLSGAGETTCGNTRCRHHDRPDGEPLSTLELPFTYAERGESKTALVKVVLCERCVKKLMWKRRKEKEAKEHLESRSQAPEVGSIGEGRSRVKAEIPGERGALGGVDVKTEEGVEVEKRLSRSRRRNSDWKDQKAADESKRQRRRDSRSLSPRSRYKSNAGTRLRP